MYRPLVPFVYFLYTCKVVLAFLVNILISSYLAIYIYIYMCVCVCVCVRVCVCACVCGVGGWVCVCVLHLAQILNFNCIFIQCCTSILKRSLFVFNEKKVELPGCKGIWTVYHKNTRGHNVDSTKMAAKDDEYHAYLIISLESRTMVTSFTYHFTIKN